MGENDSELGDNKVDWGLEFAKLEVVAAFAYWFWCQERLNESVNSYDGNSSRAWLATFVELRRAARNAQFAWVAALYSFRRLIEVNAEKSGQQEN